MHRTVGAELSGLRLWPQLNWHQRRHPTIVYDFLNDQSPQKFFRKRDKKFNSLAQQTAFLTVAVLSSMCGLSDVLVLVVSCIPTLTLSLADVSDMRGRVTTWSPISSLHVAHGLRNNSQPASNWWAGFFQKEDDLWLVCSKNRIVQGSNKQPKI